MSPQQDSVGANSSSEDNQTREPPPTQEDEEPRMITPVTPIDYAMSTLSITSPTPMFTQLATLTQPVQTTAMAGLSQGGGGSGGGTEAMVSGAQPATPPRNGLKGIAPMPFKGDKSLYDVFKTEWRMYKAINQNQDDMLIPYNRIMTMLGMVKGPLVSAWVQDYLDTIEQEVVQHGENTEILWDNFENALDDTFKDTKQKETTISMIRNLAAAIADSIATATPCKTARTSSMPAPNKHVSAFLAEFSLLYNTHDLIPLTTFGPPCSVDEVLTALSTGKLEPCPATDDEPSWAAALALPECKYWIAGGQEELQSLKDLNIFILVSQSHISPGHHLLKGKLVCKRKCNSIRKT
jgi:hypothetical protein